MDIVTVLGIGWHKASMQDILLLIVILLVPVILIIAIKVYQRIRNVQIHEQQLILFKMKRLGLSNFQIKIINNLIEIIGAKGAGRLFDNSEYFERAIGRFLTHMRGSNETEESQRMMCREITIIYDRLYFHAHVKKPLKLADDIGGDQLIYFTITVKVYLGKIVSRDSKHFLMKIFGDPGGLVKIPENEPVTFHVFRVGDAEYEFVSTLRRHDRATLAVVIPREIVRREESRHPYIDVIIPAFVSREEFEMKKKGAAPAGPEDRNVETEAIADEAMVPEEIGQEKIACTVYKINDFEAVLRMTEKMDFNIRYALEFEAMDYKFKIMTKIIASKTVEEGNALYYTVKFDEMSANAISVLKKYVYEHL